ncbi:MAG: CDP-diacylglycerol--serine O-phosphatidyltransferase [Desulfomonile tiedjei]|uniref:CDP-diacylglycerol--serine O-phosphatidyltransferase n=1 Tax=Desulfomonile tiedjei TaxID=2358 RepID=A0A9D6UYK4_9BACT|nr:CDP-diacylglycerol--serine O-phosphatidyltransferase [Desulfomonile tiedjei]
MARKRRPFFRRRRPLDGEDFPVRPPRKRLPIQRMKKGIFILPSLLTLTSIFFAFYSLVEVIKDNFALAAALILVAGFFDGIDGKVARLTNTTTRFGVELDSLADVISFGVAPAILMYKWALLPYAQIGWVCAFVFVACGALRLARFNVQTGTIDPKRFNGLPIPAAAVMLSTTVLFFIRLDLDPANFQLPLIILTLVIAFLMVSSIKFHAFKDLTLVREKPFTSTVGFVLILALIAAAPFIVPFFLCAGYIISGPILTTVLMIRNHKQKKLSSAEPQTVQEPEVPAEQLQ